MNAGNEAGTMSSSSTRFSSVRSACLVTLCTALLTAQSTPPHREDARGVLAQVPYSAPAVQTSIAPCDDFYQYACGLWMARNPIPADASRWSRLNEVSERNLVLLRGILEEAAAEASVAETSARLSGSYFAACMDEAAAEARDTGALEPVLRRIRGIGTLQELAAALPALHRIGAPALFLLAPAVDVHDSTRYMANLDQATLGLPDRGNYLRTDQATTNTREQYRQHVTRMFELLGEAGTASANAALVLDIETRLARASIDRTLRRDPKNTDNPMTLDEAARLVPALDLVSYFAAAGVPPIDKVNVIPPAYFLELQQILVAVPVASWQTYLRWVVVRTFADVLSARFIDESFSFNAKVLRGQTTLDPRWKRCVRATDADLGDALGQLYVRRTFGEDGKARMMAMVAAIRSAMEVRIDALEWMSEPAKTKAKEKLQSIVSNIGYPDRWRDYGSLRIVRNDFAANRFAARAFEFDRRLSRINALVDRGDWLMSPPAVNAYANPRNVTINFPAGILQPPFFDRQNDDPLNYGAIGAIIGHELTHLFDDQGSQFDARGNLQSWWLPEDAKAFTERTSCFVDQYSRYEAVGGLPLDGKLTLGENTADNGGLNIAFTALERASSAPMTERLDGLTRAQRFFIGYAQVWCENRTTEAERLLVQTDTHSPGRFRVNGAVANSFQFREAFSCRPGQSMVREPACRVW